MHMAVEESTGCWSVQGLQAESGNEEQFYAHAGEQIAVPQAKLDRPRRAFLEWHLAEVFKTG